MASWAVSIGTESDTFADAYKKQFKLAFFIYVKELMYPFVTQKLWNVESSYNSNIVTAHHGIHARTSQNRLRPKFISFHRSWR